MSRTALLYLPRKYAIQYRQLRDAPTLQEIPCYSQKVTALKLVQNFIKERLNEFFNGQHAIHLFQNIQSSTNCFYSYKLKAL